MDNLLAAIRSGDHAALEQVYDEWSGRLYGYFYKKTGSQYLAEELVQIAFIKLWTSRHLLSDEWPLQVQLFRIMKTSLIDVIRKEIRDTAAFQQYKSHITTTNAYTPEPATDAQLQEIHKIMDTMPPVRRKVFHMSRNLGFSYKQIALHLAISPRTVENHIAQALKQLRQLLR
ncbi:MAG: sigma-70 family RNA polymerase sigma factor [Chitinophaga sp.]|uniref:RNA polymerase sigma factor n=1 Tax=Chitinophaga sp. TaxID=1869181 RepID=UPI0025C07113|nr:sigma-70 family RNA polymerase sigma factor [Chitinophaga sp.]MBV8253567.1 sigma-70 family RNA polymerase sigma factor [Chitinophaga sp.]